ncbi:MAG TPA: Hpt domain-containing protein, partial [Nevskiaceae bacterium]|nr:Hpt domain-containing protein [Nevskiaceae bacterium]
MTQPRPNKGVHALANGLHWLHAEIARCLERVRGALEIYLESDSDDPRPLLTAAEQVRQVAGSVSMVQCLGATMLAREMRAVLEAAIAGQLKEREKAFAALSVATLQLSDYIELLAGGEPDRAVVLEPIISELRVARGRPLMSEIDLFGAQMVPLVMATDACLMEAPQHTDGDSQALAQAELANYQRHFVDWFRSRQVPVALQAMNGAALRIAQSVSAAPLRRLWWNLTLLTESLLPVDTTDLPVELKRLVGRSGVELQRLAQRGEGAAADTAAGVAIQVLYWLARASQRSARAQRLAEALHLSEVLPDEATLARARQHLHAPNAGALAQVRKELGRELQTVKDNIDLVVRTGGRAGTQPDQIAAHLRRIGDTLGMLGLDRLRQVLYNQATGVLALPPDAPQWLDVATTLVRVETALDEKLVRGARATTPSAALDTGGPGGRSSVAALAQEALVDSAQIESAMAAGVAQHSTAGLAGLGPRIQVLVASLRVGGLGAAADQLAVIGRYIDAGGAARAIGDPAATDRLAEAFASVEIYLEGLRDGLPQPEALMARVAACVAPLAKELETRTTEPPAQIAVAAAASASPVAPSPAPSMAIPPAPRAAAASEPVDPEILDIFVEEAGEVVSGLKRDLPRLERDLQDKDALTEVRRAFHTLKGSGRMVGASGIGEFAWAIEQLLNRCRDATLAVRTPILDVVREATELVPRLIVGLQAGDTAAAGFPEVQALSARADALRTEEPGVSAELYGIFRDDARERLKLVGNWLAGLRPDAAPVPVEAEIVRAFHTLRGSAAVARAAPVQRVAKAVEDYLTHLRRADTGLAADGQALLAEVVAAFGRWIGSTELAPAATRESPALQARVEQQQAALASVAATADTVPDRDAYTLSALEELQGIEAEVNGWPQASGAVHGAALAARFSDFGRQAAEHACPTLAEVARALAQRLAAVGSTPPPALLPALADIFEALYQRLDALRDGEREADAATLLDQVAGLPLVDVRAGRSPILPDESAP